MPQKDSRLDKLPSLIKDKYEHGDPAHDWAHILRVVKNCEELASAESADPEILIPAAYLHDVVNVPKDHPDRIRASEMAAQEAAGILKSIGYSESEITKIASVITEHSYSLGKEPSCIESAILQDADRLDAIGAIGIMRLVSCGVRLGSKYYDLDEPIAKTRELNDKAFSIDHLYVKLFKLADKMNTQAAKEEAMARTRFMESFVAQLCGELGEASPRPSI